MKVVHVINSLSTGGAERLVVNLIKQFNNLEADQFLYILTKADHFFLNEIKETKVEYNFGKWDSVYNPLHILDLRKILFQADVVNVHLFPSLYWVAISKLIFGSKAKIVFTEHSTSNNRRKYKILKFVDSLIYRFYDSIITISEETKLSLDKWVPGTMNKSIVINNGIEIEKFMNAQSIDLRKELCIEEDSKLLLCVGSLRSAKNHQLLLKAFSKSALNFRLVVIGAGALLEDLKVLAQSLKIEERLYFLGLCNNVEQYYKACDLFVLPSKWEGFGLVAAEAMAAGIPVLVSNVPGLSQVVGNAGFQFESENVNDLAHKIDYIFANPEIANYKVELAKERVKQFSIEAMAQNYIAEYKKILADEK